mmetsp:Transcript_6924/g.19500  ORF Transcript_6924/g.19500 Transcript_6924/m.19500 type:complete len:222 (-) Transcript_6924:2516-3181(-)
MVSFCTQTACRPICHGLMSSCMPRPKRPCRSCCWRRRTSSATATRRACTTTRTSSVRRSVARCCVSGPTGFRRVGPTNKQSKRRGAWRKRAWRLRRNSTTCRMLSTGPWATASPVERRRPGSPLYGRSTAGWSRRTTPATTTRPRSRGRALPALRRRGARCLQPPGGAVREAPTRPRPSRALERFRRPPDLGARDGVLCRRRGMPPARAGGRCSTTTGADQ